MHKLHEFDTIYSPFYREDFDLAMRITCTGPRQWDIRLFKTLDLPARQLISDCKYYSAPIPASYRVMTFTRKT